MTLTSSLSIAMSGLTAASRAAEVVSANVANAMTPGYARREIALSSQSVGDVGAGVQVDGVTRIVNERALADQRNARASLSNNSALADAWLAVEKSVGLPTEPGSLADHLNALEASLIQAASRPDEVSRLDEVALKAVGLTDKINAISDDFQQMRMDADADIAMMVESLNAKLSQVETLNWQIFRAGNSGQDASGLQDQRQTLVGEIAEFVPVTQVPRDGGQIALFTPGGAVLLDGPAAEFEFSASSMITAEMSLGGGTLSGLVLNGHSLAVGSAYDPIAGGTLAAAFSIRDEIATEPQSSLDAFARDLIERFQDSGLDPTLSTGSAGVFTDGGVRFTGPDDTGLSSDISVNDLVHPEAIAENWRLRSGLASVSAGEVGDATLLTAMAERLGEASVVSSGPSMGLSRSTFSLASDFLSIVSTKSQLAIDQQAFDASRLQVLEYEASQDGVDTDDEMQKLLLVEQSYAANARVIQTLDELMQQILQI
ncbi:flagellar hook-associated protein 1 FlgK [Aliiruegeria haliotis]|uniref:Flagellar hook-associated protein 1 n=1 Tax=Aliiruegeria haliotis TaxID=1280846 RepID=A0A2T0RFA2_9RHOB|nr:flagellar hook-associated protein FlgK [Aliiruegeria haliotis]PRY19853.1 flagellar hook-associated protein 1 FlgK [Aliiruegeria haliotis]